MGMDFNLSPEQQFFVGSINEGWKEDSYYVHMTGKSPS